MNQPRRHIRIDFVQEIKVAIGDAIHDGQTRNISRGGIFVQTDGMAKFGDKVELTLRLPGVPGECVIPCIVRWAMEGKGLGVQFQSLRAIETWALNKLIRAGTPSD